MACGACQNRKLIERAKSAFQSGNSQEAWEMVEMTDFSPEAHPGFCFFKAKLAMECGFWDQALSLIEGLMTVAEPRPPLMLAYADCLISLGRIPEARMVLASQGEDGSCFVRNILQARIAARYGDEDRVFEWMKLAMNLNKSGATSLALRCPELVPMTLGAFCCKLIRAVAG